MGLWRWFRWVCDGMEGCTSGDQVASWKMVCETKRIQWRVLSMCMMGEMLCSGSADKSISIWKREAFGKLCRIGVISGHEGPVKCLQASPNSVGGGFMLYSGSLDKSLRVWWVSKPSTTQKSTEEKSILELEILQSCE
ncbi:hypothetical protein M0R45_036776 [Rubus argutus]|uniref:Uncharacterized protein n=1 Tax=Rubus argutus TaxID=59490 RepID=A0AAW1VZU1_RUBAR